MTQNDRVLKYLDNHGYITTMVAFNELGITRLASRVNDLKKLGWPITGVMRYGTDRDGNKIKWKEYRLA